jgi:hypothetical protein
VRRTGNAAGLLLALGLAACGVEQGADIGATPDTAAPSPAPCTATTDELPVPAAAAAGDGTPFPWEAIGEVALLDGFDPAEVLPGGPPPDGILPVDTPCTVDVATADAWLQDDESVLLVEVGGEARAYPLAIMTQHEIVNDVLAGVPLTVTYCPLCNSGLAFERVLDGEAWDFGTSGRLLRSNLVMYDRQTRTLWSQFSGTALWGDPAVVGRELVRVPTQLLGWSTVRESRPDATVLGRASVPGREYGSNPYPGYEGTGSGFLFRGPTDERLDPDARVVGLGDGDAAVALPLDRLREERAVRLNVDGAAVSVVFAPGQASALDAASVADGVEVGQTGAFAVDRLEPDGDGRFLDPATGAVHDVTGRVVEGDAPDLVRVPLDDTFWFVWFAFHPGTAIAP